MPDFLRRTMAPLTEAAWAEVDETAMRVLKGQLSARTLVDFDGPHGTSRSAVNLGRLELAKKDAPGGVPWGLRQVQPLIEIRLPFTLSQMELDNISRGCTDPDMASVEEAAHKVALFEEATLYKGFADGKVEGIIPASAHKPLKLPAAADDLAKTVADATRTLLEAGVQGPYALVLGSDAYFPLMQAGKGGYPPRRIIRDMLAGGTIVWSPAVDGGVLLSTRGGDFELTVGDDISIGYASHTRDAVELYFVESFTFRVLEPAAAIALESRT